jgi:hypothetical protein
MNIYAALLMFHGHVTNAELAISLSKERVPAGRDLVPGKTGEKAFAVNACDLPDAACAKC